MDMQGVTQDELKMLLGNPDQDETTSTKSTISDQHSQYFLPRSKRSRVKRKLLFRFFGR